MRLFSIFTTKESKIPSVFIAGELFSQLYKRMSQHVHGKSFTKCTVFYFTKLTTRASCWRKTTLRKILHSSQVVNIIGSWLHMLITLRIFEKIRHPFKAWCLWESGRRFFDMKKRLKCGDIVPLKIGCRGGIHLFCFWAPAGCFNPLFLSSQRPYKTGLCIIV